MLQPLTQVDWTNLQKIVEHAIRLPDSERKQFIENACADSPNVRLRVEAMLTAFDGTTFNSDLVAQSLDETFSVELPIAGTRLGPYRILEIVGQGGMGVVYRAIRDDDEYHKEVAIKIVSGGFFAPGLRQRFLRERQILANLEHPNIARLLDGGTTPDGLPYVVMEFVSGKPIDRYCSEADGGKGLNLRHKIELLIQVTHAVEYAHRHLVVHRDLKPDNIHVTEAGAPKLLDFGIAKALDMQDLGLQAMPTIDAVRLMTPEYASPEQVRGEPVTTATDVYQIGALLYLLLTGTPPFRMNKNTRMGELERMICDVPPPPPRINRDLDQIVLHALEKDPRRRYAAAGDLARDLERYLNGFPVTARPASAAYRAGKFIRRNKLSVGAAATFLLLLIGFTLALAFQVRRAKQNLHQAQVVSSFLQTVFASADPDINNGAPPTVEQLLAQGIKSVRSSLASEPEAQADLLSTFGQTYADLGQYQRSHEILTEALTTYRNLHKEQSANYVQCLTNDADVAPRAGDFDQGIAEARKAVALSTSLFGENSVNTASALDTLGFDLSFTDHDKQAEPVCRKDIAVWEKVAGPESPRLFAGINTLAHLLAEQRRDTEAESLYRRELSILQKQSGTRQDIADAQRLLGLLLNQQGRNAEAEPILRQSLETETQVLGPDHSFVGLSYDALATVLTDEGRFAEAKPLFLKALNIHTKNVGPSSRYVASDENLLGRFYEQSDNLQQAEHEYRNALALRMKFYKYDSLAVTVLETSLGRLLTKREKFDQASSLLQTSFANQQKHFGNDSPLTANVLIEIGRLKLAEHKDSQAEATLRKVLAIDRVKAPEIHPPIADADELLGETLIEEHRATEAVPLLTEAASIYKNSLPPGAPARRNAELILAQTKSHP